MFSTKKLFQTVQPVRSPQPARFRPLCAYREPRPEGEKDCGRTSKIQEASPLADEATAWRAVNTLRVLSMDAVNKQHAGHMGGPLGQAPMAYVLWSEFLRFNPSNPSWADRDRFVLSAGHGSILQYSLLHLTGYDLPMEEIKEGYCRAGSMTPGHPENLVTPGVEVTTGPLGQGLANAVGMAVAEKHLRERFQREGAPNVVDHRTFAICSDGDLMEGISYEASSLAGHWGLDRLIILWDDNKSTIDGPTTLSFTEDVCSRFRAQGWDVGTVEDGNDLDAIRASLDHAVNTREGKPHFIAVRTKIGSGVPGLEGSNKIHSHGIPPEAAEGARERWGMKDVAPFTVPDDVRALSRRAGERGKELEAQWHEGLRAYSRAHPGEAAELEELLAGPPGWEKNWDKNLPTFTPDSPPEATRKLSGALLQHLAARLPGLIGGSADLATSNATLLKEDEDFGRGGMGAGRNLRFGIREHAMVAISTGIAHHRTGLIPFAGTFTVFSDYCRPAIRLAALSHAHELLIFTHDSIGVGQDGPTHQPVEHLSALRAIPNLHVQRPADGNEVTGSYLAALRRTDGPTAFLLTRQSVPHLPGTSAEGVARGAYVVYETGASDDKADKAPHIILMASGSELQIAIEAAHKLEGRGLVPRTDCVVRVVSFPCFEAFEAQDQAYKEQMLPRTVLARVAVEAGVEGGWGRYMGSVGQFVGMKGYGVSTPGDEVFKHFGITSDEVKRAALRSVFLEAKLKEDICASECLFKTNSDVYEVGWIASNTDSDEVH